MKTLSALCAALLLCGFLGGAFAAQTVNFADNSTNSTSYNLTTVNGNTLILNSLGSGSATQSGTISNAGFVEKTGAGTINLTTANTTFSGTFTLTAGTIGIGDNAAFGTSTIVINGGEIRAFNAARTVSNALTLNSSFTIGRLTTFSGNASLGASITITANNPDAAANNDSTFSGIISDGGNARSVTIAEGPNGIGTGSIVFSGSNTYTGGTIVSSGRLKVTGSLASSGTVTVNGGNLVFGNAAQTIGTFSGSGGTVTLSNGHVLTVSSASDSTYGGVINGMGSFVKSGSGTLALTGDNTYSGTTTISGGTLRIGNGLTGTIASDINNNSVVEFFNDVNTTYSGTLSGSGQLRKSGTGTLTLDGVNDNFTGEAYLATGALNLGTLDAIGSTGPITFAGGTLQFSAGNALDYSARFNPAAGQNVRLDTNGQSVTLATALTSSGGTLTKLGAGTLTLAGANTYSGTTTVSAGTLQIGDGTAGSIAGPLQDDAAVTFLNNGAASYAGIISGAGSITKSGSGTLTLSGASTFTGATTVSAGTLRATTSAGALGTGAATLVLNGGNLALANDTALSFGRNTAVLADATVTVDRLNTGAAQTQTLGTLSIGAQTLSVTRGSNATSGVANLTFGAATLTGSTVFAPGANTQLNLAGIGESGGSYGPTLNGPGILNVNANSTYTGVTTINGGVLAVNNLSNGGAASPTGTSSSAASNIVINGGELRITGGGASNTDRLFTLGTAGGSITATGSGTLNFNNTGSIALAGTNTARTLTIGGDDTIAPTTFAPVVGDNGTGATSLVKSGLSAWILTGANSYTGGTTITGGALVLTGSGSISTGNLFINGGVLATSGTTLPLGTGPGQVRFGASGGGFAAYNGPLSVTTFGSSATWDTSDFLPSGAPLIFGTSIANNTVTLATNIALGSATRTITVNDNTASAADIAVLSGVISGNGGLTKSGAGTLFLNGANTYTGVTTISGGTLVPASTSSLSSANLVFGGGVLATMNGGALAPTTLALQLGTGDGQVQFSGTGGGGFAAYGGPLTVTLNGGTGLTWASTSGFLPNNAPLILDSVNSDNVVTLTNDLALGSAIRTVTVNDNIASTADGAVLSGVISGAGGLTKNGVGTLTLGAANTYTGATTIAAGTVVISTIGNVNSGPGPLGNPANAATGIITLGSSGNAATLRYTGAGSTTDRVLDLAAGNNNATVTLDASGSGPLVFTSGVTSSTTQGKTLALSGTNAGLNSIQGIIANNAGGGVTSLSKSGTGTWLLTGANTYTGATSILGGTLALSGSGAISAANLTFNGGVLATSGTFSRALGTGAGQVQFASAGGGFAAYGGPLSITGFTGTPTWASTGGFLGGSATLVLGSVNATDVVTWTNSFSLGGSGRAISVPDNPATTADGAVISGAISGSGGGIVKTGAGMLTLTGTNTFTGASTINQGTLRLGSASAIAANGALSVVSNTAAGAATLDLAGFNATANGLTLGSATGADTASVSNIVDTVGGGALTLAGNVTFNATGNPLGSTISTALSLGGTTRTFTVNDSATAPVDLTISGSIGQTATAGITKAGAGTLLLSGSNTFTGPTTVNLGTLRLGSSTALANPAANGLTVATNAAGGTAALDLGGYSTTVSSITIGGSSGGDAASVSNIVDSVGGGTLALAGPITFNNTGNPLGSTISVPLDLGSATRTFTVNDSTTAATDLTISGVLSGSAGIIKSGNGTLLLSNANTYTGGTTISGGGLAAGSDTAFGNGLITLSGGTILGGGGTRTLANPILQTSGSTIGGSGDLVFNSNFTNSNGNVALSVTNTGTTTFTGTFALSNSAANSSFNLDTNGGLVTISGPITNGTGGSTASGFIKRSAGTLEFGGVNTYGGSTTVTDGTLRIVGTGTLPATPLSVTGAYPNSHAVLDVNGHSVSVNGLTMGGANTGDTVSSSSVVDTASGGSLNLLGNVTFNSNGNPLGSTISAALNLGSATRSFTIADSTTAPIDLIVSGIISADPGVGLTKAGAGTLMISGPNTYTGPTNINLGTLRLGSAAALPAASTLNVYANSAGAVALLDINGRNATAAALNLGANSGGANSASIANVIDSAGGGLLTVNGGVNYSATNNPQGSTIFAALDLGSASRTFTIANSTAAANDLTVAGIISAAPGVGLSKAGAGTLMLTGANTYTGTTTISAGTLSLAGSGALAGDIVVASGATFDTSSPAGFTIVSGRTLTANGTFTAGSGGTLTVSGTLKGSGTVAAAGIVSVNSGGLLSPGNSLGTLATGDETWNSGGGYVWELNNASDASGAKGVTYDWMNISGTLTLNSTSDGKFTIYLTSLNAGNTPGSVPNFVEGTSYSYVIATATSGITGFNASKFNVDTTGFSNPIADASIFRVGNDLVLQFTAIPEPSTYAIGIPGLLGAAILLRRRRFFSEGKAE